MKGPSCPNFILKSRRNKKNPNPSITLSLNPPIPTPYNPTISRSPSSQNNQSPIPQSRQPPIQKFKKNPIVAQKPNSPVLNSTTPKDPQIPPIMDRHSRRYVTSRQSP